MLYARTSGWLLLWSAVVWECAAFGTPSRRHVIQSIGGSAALPFLVCQPANAADGLASRLAQKDPSLLQNRLFNIPPGAQVYPSWMRGTWNVSTKLNGYIFPSRKIGKEAITQNPVVPGFQKCSIAATADVGKEGVTYRMKIDSDGYDDRVANFQSSIDAYLGYKAVNEVLYDRQKNPNRLSIDFVDYRTVNAERIELFCNARESEEYLASEQQIPTFVCGEFARQVTFGTGSTVGVPRQVGTNYGLFWTWQLQEDQSLRGNLLVAGYLDPQDSMYFQETVQPVVIYSHVIKAQRVIE